MNYNFLLKTCNTIIAFFCIVQFLFSQTDAHYWTHQFGAKGLLMNGAVIASTEDETAIFYNPGAMTSDDDFNLSLSFLTPAYSLLKTKNYLGDNNDITDDGLGFAPGLGSVGFNPWGSKRIRMAITSFTRFKSDIRFRGRVVGEASDGNDELFIGNLDLSRRLRTRWYGIGASLKLTNFLSVGASHFVTFHSESSNFFAQKDLVHRNNPTDVILSWRKRFKYSFSSRGGMLTKFGVLLRIGEIKIGATLTTPTYRPISKGASYEFEDFKFFGQDSASLISNLDNANFRDYKTPLSVGFGLDFPIGKTHLSFSTEYFKPINSYIIMEDTDDPFDGLSTNGFSNSISVRGGNQGVLNLAVGCETKLREKVSLIWGFRTDFNQRKKSQDIETLQFLSTTPDVFHISVGSSVEIWSSKFSFGFDYGFGRKTDDTRLVDISDINSENFFDFTGDGKVISNFQSINFILAYDFSYRKK